MGDLLRTFRALWLLTTLALAPACAELQGAETYGVDAGIVCDSPRAACDGPGDCERGEVCGDEGRCECVAPLAIDTRALPSAVVGTPYSFAIAVRGGAPPYSFQLLETYVSPQLDWLSLDPVTGRLSGIPPELLSEARGLRISIEDQAQQSAAQSLTLAVGACEDGEQVACFVAQDGACMVGEGPCEGGAPAACTSNSPSSDLGHCGPDCEACDRERANACIEGACTCGQEPECEAGETCCGEGDDARCVDLASDADSCGECGVRCDAGEGERRVAVCRGGVCQAPACEPGWDACELSRPDDCTTDITSSDVDCGMCGRVCPIPNRSDGCRDGRCACGDDERTCSGLETCCAGQACTDLSIGARVEEGIARCGDCGAELCADPLGHGEATCDDGSCGTRCDSSSEEEWADCEVPVGTMPLDCSVDLLSDAQHCGGCDVVCPSASSPPETGSAVCAMGTCAIACAEDHIECEVCSGTVPVGCFDIGSDPARCGGCEMACSTDNIAVACQEGACTGTCATDYGDCDADKRGTGCETSLLNNDAHCGACQRACSGINRQPGCAEGVCTGACVAGYGDCDDSRDNGCETDLSLSLEHCGGCNVSCSSLHVDNAVCEETGCNGTCTPGYDDCNDSQSDGCEIHIDEDVDRCGSCGSPACSGNNITRDCSGGQCVGACTPYVWEGNGQSYERFADCANGKQVDGCETDLWYDSANCGACGGACPLGYVCAWDGFAAAGCYPICEGCCCSAVGAAKPSGSGRPSALFAGMIALTFAWRRSVRRGCAQRA
jgi:hypothetical protein